MMKKPWKVLTYIILGIQAVITIYPLAWMIIGSLKDNISFLADPWALPDKLRLYNYQVAWEEGIQNYMVNSILITVVTVCFVILLSCTFSFMLARFPFKGSGILIGLFFAGMMIPVHCTLIPLYNMMNMAGLIDHLWAFCSLMWRHPFRLRYFLHMDITNSFQKSWRKRQELTDAVLQGCFSEFSCHYQNR